MRNPSGCFRSTAMSRLPRWQPMKDPTTLPRMASPRVGSTLMTSAPRSASSIGPKGPARNWPKSMTRMPSSGPGISDHPARPQRGDLGVVASEGPEHLVGMGSGQRLRALDLAGRRPEEDGDAELGGGPDLGVDHLDHRTRRPELGVVEALVG